MRIIPLTSITIGPRQRKRIESGPLVELENDIAKHGLLNPPTYRRLPGESGDPIYQLIAGERRTRAIQKLAERGVAFYCDGTLIEAGNIPILTLQETLSRADLKQVEFSENKIRENLSWQDEQEALAEIYNLRKAEEPTITQGEVVRELIESGTVKPLHGTTDAESVVRNRLRKALTITEHLDDPTIAKARNESEAYNLVLKKQEEELNAAIARRRLKSLDSSSPSILIRHGSALEILPRLDSGIADLILADPPFGIGASSGGFRQRTVHHHNYDDTPENARAVAESILTDGFRIAKPQANLFMFCDIDLFPWLKTAAARMGWTPFRTPLVWRKSQSEGMAPWQGKGPRRTYELIFYATKGQRGLIASPVDVLEEKRVSRSERIHAAQKPVELLETLITCSTLPGDFVLDPCCGSGSSLVAAKNTKRIGLGIEIDEGHYNTAMSNVFATNGEKESAAE
jgi:DNA modification methylase